MASGLRERNKARTRDAISAAAIRLFLERGFDDVSVAEVAAAAEVSKPTLFKHFPSKEDLVLHRITDHRGEPARVVRRRAPGEAPLSALHRHFVEGLRRRDPITGLNDAAEVLAYYDMVLSTPRLSAHLSRYTEQDEEDLAGALDEAAGQDGLTGRLAASQVITVQQILARDNWGRLMQGRSAEEVEPGAVAAADHAFQLLRTGLGERYG